MNVFLESLGCRLNEAELQSWSRDFRSAGHEVVARIEDAQLVVFNTCAVTAEAARKSRKLANRLHRANPSAQMVLTGCYAELEPEATAELAGVDLVINNHDKDWLLRMIESELDLGTLAPPSAIPRGEPKAANGRTRAFVKVQDGCRNRCSFCIVTVARGEERSHSIDRVVEEIADLVDRGYQEAVLTGVHLGGYGSDFDGPKGSSALAELVRAVLERTKIARLRLSSLEPWDITPQLFELWQDPRLGPHLHLPLQSGSDAVLRRMARRCNTTRYAELVAAARETVPALTITTDVIVGFPGESDAEWQETLDFCQRIDFAHMHIFSYSARHGTAAARMDDQIPTDVKRQRSRELHRLAGELKQRCLARFADSERLVLWEGAGELQGNGLLRFSGLTDNYLRCVVDVPPGTELENRLTPARLATVDLDHYQVELSPATLRSYGESAAAS